MPGLVTATIPVSVKLDRKCPVKQLLQDVQDQATSMVPYEQLGLQSTAKIDEHTKEACNFSSLMVVQPAKQLGLEGIGSSSSLLQPAPEGDGWFAGDDIELL